MARMIRKQVYIDERHAQMLERLARERGVTESEVVRDAIERVEPAEATASHVPDPEAARKFFAFIDELSRRPPRAPERPRWTRESLYEERIGRWTKS